MFFTGSSLSRQSAFSRPGKAWTLKEIQIQIQSIILSFTQNPDPIYSIHRERLLQHTQGKKKETRGLTSIALRDHSWNGFLDLEGEVKDIGGVVLPGQRVEHLGVNSHLNVVSFGVTHLTKPKHRRSFITG